MSTSQAQAEWGERLALSRCYWASGRGRALITAQAACLGPVLEARRDRHALELSMGASLLAHLSAAGPTHAVQWAPALAEAKSEATLVCPPRALALPDECLDLTLLHHFLEHCPDAHQALAEAARVTRDSGLMVIFGFQPLGLAALAYRLGKKRRHYPGNGRWYTPGRLRDWLAFVDFEIEGVDYCGFGPGRGGVCHERRETLGRRHNVPLGTSYMIRARRRRRQAPVQRLRFGLQPPAAAGPLGITRGQTAPGQRSLRARRPGEVRAADAGAKTPSQHEEHKR
ncbi:methyltransferase domain-containing protein [Halomonas piscis]|uniref:Methyltransferase domain-containing protein n=1 Tax=Halomonas piscis TaxID=3031727 RepID=A0ABY9YW82_9GAMM|nr:methyltransferase domain-containing protein [Halomonas piscis]WNK18852.1 methyltransferase domain-containing protein [Halomonas piscis]